MVSFDPDKLLIIWGSIVRVSSLILSDYSIRNLEYYFTVSNLFYVMTKLRRKIKDEQRIILI